MTRCTICRSLAGSVGVFDVQRNKRRCAAAKLCLRSVCPAVGGLYRRDGCIRQRNAHCSARARRWDTARQEPPRPRRRPHPPLTPCRRRDSWRPTRRCWPTMRYGSTIFANISPTPTPITIRCAGRQGGLMRSDGTEVLPCRASEPLFECSSAPAIGTGTWTACWLGCWPTKPRIKQPHKR